MFNINVIATLIYLYYIEYRYEIKGSRPGDKSKGF